MIKLGTLRFRSSLGQTTKVLSPRDLCMVRCIVLGQLLGVLRWTVRVSRLLWFMRCNSGWPVGVCSRRYAGDALALPVSCGARNRLRAQQWLCPQIRNSVMLLAHFIGCERSMSAWVDGLSTGINLHHLELSPAGSSKNSTLAVRSISSF